MQKGKSVFLMSLLLVSVGSISVSNASAEENKTHNVDIVFGSSNVENGRFYNPPIVKINVGDSVSWMNLDKERHTVTDGTLQSQWGKVFNSGVMVQGKEFKFEFTTPGEYPYLCAFHPWMIGKVIVEDPIANSVPSNVNVLQKLNVFIKSEKQSYEEDEIVRFTVEVLGAGNRPTDPDVIDAQFGSKELKPVTLSRVDVGKYLYSITELKPASYNLKVNVSKENLAPGSSLLTVHVLKKDISNVVPEVQEPIINIQADQKQYYLGDMVTIAGSVSHIVENKSIVFQVFDGEGKLYTRGQSQINGKGVFEWKFKLPDTAVKGSWTVKTKYFDDVASASFEIVNASTKEHALDTIPEQPQPLVSTPVMKYKDEGVTVAQSAITDQLNSQLYDVTTGQSVVIRSLIQNNLSTQQAFVYIMQIKDSNGVVMKLEAIEGVLPAGKSFTVGVSWMPEKAGNYTAEAFVWKSLQESVPLSLNLLSTTITVTD